VREEKKLNSMKTVESRTGGPDVDQALACGECVLHTCGGGNVRERDEMIKKMTS
jgi:hypothetical protein